MTIVFTYKHYLGKRMEFACILILQFYNNCDLIPDEMDRSSAGLLSGRRAESTLHKGTVQKSQSSGKAGQQERVP